MIWNYIQDWNSIPFGLFEGISRFCTPEIPLVTGYYMQFTLNASMTRVVCTKYLPVFNICICMKRQ